MRLITVRFLKSLKDARPRTAEKAWNISMPVNSGKWLDSSVVWIVQFGAGMNFYLIATENNMLCNKMVGLFVL